MMYFDILQGNANLYVNSIRFSCLHKNINLQESPWSTYSDIELKFNTGYVETVQTKEETTLLHIHRKILSRFRQYATVS